MSKFYYVIFILFFSCIDLINQESHYNSLFFSGGSWIEIKEFNEISNNSDDYSLQFWISGGIIDTNEAPAIFSLTDQSGDILLSLLRDPNLNNRIITIINSQVYTKDLNELDLFDSNEFHLISIVFSNNSSVEVFIDSTSIINDTNNLININDELLVIGAIANKERTILKNFWYGYIDEIRLWNTELSDSIITFHAEHPNKLSQHYRYTDIDGNPIPTYLDSLIGIWRLNINEPQATIIDDSGFSNDGYIYTLNGFSLQLSKKGAD